jgi:polyphosphate kinase
VSAFLTVAAEDPAVRVIMTTLYRTGGSESSIVRALQGAAARGKQIVVLVELKARFDEAHNLERARALERAGAHVVYGVLGLKTHTKLASSARNTGVQPPRRDGNYTRSPPGSTKTSACSRAAWR